MACMRQNNRPFIMINLLSVYQVHASVFRLGMLTGLLVLTGCQTLPSKLMSISETLSLSAPAHQEPSEKSVATKAKPAREDAADPVPKHVVAIWSDAVMRLPGKPPTRGLGGRLYFYDEKQKPIKTHGQLVVYGYDDSIDGTEKTAPDRKYVFTADEFQRHYSESEIGPSYSVWLPWDVDGGPQMAVSVLPSFTTGDGQLVMGELARHVLPGTKGLTSKDPAGWAASPGRTSRQTTTRIETKVTGVNAPGAMGTHASDAHGVALASYQESVDVALPAPQYVNGQIHPTSEQLMRSGNPQSALRMRSTTIRLPQSVKQRLAQSQSEGDPGGIRGAMGYPNVLGLAHAQLPGPAEPAGPYPGRPVPPAAGAVLPVAENPMIPGRLESTPHSQNPSVPSGAGNQPTAHFAPDTHPAPDAAIAPRGLGLPPSERNLSAPPVHSAASPALGRVRPSVFPTAAGLPVGYPRR